MARVIRAGEIFGGTYRIARTLGRGGMGTVYDAVHTSEGTRVALKVLNDAHIDETAEIRQRVTRFEREAEAVSTIASDHVARMYGAGTDPTTGTRYIAMEYLEGRDLQKVLRQGALRPDVALKIAAQACAGLVAAHRAGFIHRDIKPANVFLAEAPGGVTVKLLDFGIAKVSDGRDLDPARVLTNTGSLLGTPHYLAPEQVRGSKQIDHRADLWSLGITLYHSLTGHVPHAEASSIFELIREICAEPPEDVREAAPGVPGEIAAIVGRALQLEPEARFESAEEMLGAMDRALSFDRALSLPMLAPLTGPEVDATQRRSASSLDASPESMSSAPSHPLSARTARSVVRPTTGETPMYTLVDQSAAARPAWHGTAIVGAIVAIVTAGIGVLTLRTGRPQAAAGITASAEAPLAASTQKSAPDAALVRRVSLVVDPVDAAVEIDGAPVAAAQGAVTITGVLGSVHRVRLAKGREVRTVDVVVTEAGAQPPRLAIASSGSPSASSSAPRRASPAHSARTKLRTSFE